MTLNPASYTQQSVYLKIVKLVTDSQSFVFSSVSVSFHCRLPAVRYSAAGREIAHTAYWWRLSTCLKLSTSGVGVGGRRGGKVGTM